MIRFNNSCIYQIILLKFTPPFVKAFESKNESGWVGPNDRPISQEVLFKLSRVFIIVPEKNLGCLLFLHYYEGFTVSTHLEEVMIKMP